MSGQRLILIMGIAVLLIVAVTLALYLVTRQLDNDDEERQPTVPVVVVQVVDPPPAALGVATKAGTATHRAEPSPMTHLDFPSASA